MAQEITFVGKKDDEDEEQTHVSWSRYFGRHRSWRRVVFPTGSAAVKATYHPNEFRRGQHSHHRSGHQQGGERDQGVRSDPWDYGRSRRQPHLHQLGRRLYARRHRRKDPEGNQENSTEREPQPDRYHSGWEADLCRDRPEL